MVVILGVLLGLGLLAVLRLIRGLPALPTILPRRQSPVSSSTRTNRRVLAAGAVLGLVVAVVTRNLVFGVVAGTVAGMWPQIVGGGKAERAGLAKLEGLAQWTESLRDLAQKGAGLESVVPKTVDTAADVLAGPLRLLSRRLSVKVPLPQALALFADEVDDASADMVVAALALAARQRRGKLSDVLTALSASLRDELTQRTKVMRERNGIRREALQVALLTAGLVAAANLFAPPTVPGGDGGAFQVVSLMLAGAYVWVFARVRKLAEPEPEPRFLSSAADVLEAATYRPKGVQL